MVLWLCFRLWSGRQIFIAIQPLTGMHLPFAQASGSTEIDQASINRGDIGRIAWWVVV
jgi:hypothetical protein